MSNPNYPISTKFVDPLTDFGFRFFFASEPNKDILIEFLNDLFDGEKHIMDLEYRPNEHDGDGPEEKRVIFDLSSRGSNGEHFLIEMQRTRQAFFKDRSIYYASRLIQRQLPKGRASNNYELPEVYFIAILEFKMEADSDQYFYDIALLEKNTGKQFYNKLGFKFLDLSNFVKEESDLVTNRDKWMFMLKHMSKLDKIPTIFNQEIFKRIFKISEVSKLTEEERMEYEASLKARWDYENAIAYTKQVAREEERTISEAKLAKALEEERAKAEAEKAKILKDSQLNTARELKKLGLSVPEIAKATRLSEEEIKEA
ncbi:Rpn family recombination-promoting nuclease/putative transposase [Desertivirga arenae]|uniref:Rpn family recombination-promoting nuclease/putative transposase n=1 Tax=Desertivirga arenae TaxID=2810309 RepID=UPI001A956604|nr:Rpn family recombination-promoting nuclease/putative transposase [Pedobacter sp. SYSU D00823]